MKVINLDINKIKIYEQNPVIHSELREWNKEVLGIEITGLENLDQLGFTEDELILLELGELPESLEIEKEQQDISGSHVDKLKFGNCVVVMTEEEKRKLSQRYDEYVNDKGTDYGFVTELLGE